MSAALVGVVMGSDSDWPKIDAAKKARLIERVRDIESVPDMSKFFAGIL